MEGAEFGINNANYLRGLFYNCQRPRLEKNRLHKTERRKKKTTLDTSFSNYYTCRIPAFCY